MGILEGENEKEGYNLKKKETGSVGTNRFLPAVNLFQISYFGLEV